MHYSVYVGRIPNDTTKEELMELFAAHGPKEAVVLKKEESKIFAFGFVRFDNPQAVIDVIKEGEWTLRGSSLTVDISQESRTALRQITVAKRPTPKAVERDNSVRARVKEGCKLINKEVDIIHGEKPLDAGWVISCMENCPPKYAPKLTGSPDPSCLLTKEDLCLQLEQGPFSASEPGAGERRAEKVMDGVKVLLLGMHSKLEEAINKEKELIAQSLHEAGASPEQKELPRNPRMLKSVISLMESMGLNSFQKLNPLKENIIGLGAGLDSIDGANKRHIRDRHDSGMSVVKTQQPVDLESRKQKSMLPQHHSGLLQWPEHTSIGKGHLSTSDEHLLSVGMSGPGGPSSQCSEHTRGLCQPEACNPELSVPGGPPFSASSCNLQESVLQSDLQGAVSNSSVLRQELLSKSSPTSSWQDDHQSSGSFKSQGCHSSPVSHVTVSAVHTLRHTGRSFSHSDGNFKKPTTGVSDTPCTEERSNIPQRGFVHSQSFSSPFTQQPCRSLDKGFHHRTEVKKSERKSLKLLKQTNYFSGMSSVSRKTGDISSPIDQDQTAISSGNQSAQCSEEDQELNYVVPEKFKSALESEDAAALQNKGDVWQELGKANYEFLGKNTIDEEELDRSDTSKTSTKRNNRLSRYNTYGKDSHIPQRLHVVTESPSAKMVLRSAELESTLPDSRLTVSSHQPHVTERSTEKISASPSNSRGQSSESPSPGRQTPVPPLSLYRMGRGRGAIHAALLDTLQKQAGQKQEDETTDGSTTVHKSGLPPVTGRGRGLKTLQLPKK